MLINQYLRFYMLFSSIINFGGKMFYEKSSKNDYVLNQVKTPIDENIQLQQIAESANITKKALMENIISSYLHEEKVSELLPNMIDQNRRLSEFLNDLKEITVKNYASTEQMKNLLYEIAGLDDVFDKETQKFLEKEKQELGIKDDKD